MCGCGRPAHYGGSPGAPQSSGRIYRSAPPAEAESARSPDDEAASAQRGVRPAAVAVTASAPPARRRAADAPVAGQAQQSNPHLASKRSFNTESYDRIYENDFLRTKEKPLSTFGIDVDTASYSNVRRFLRANSLPPAGAVRIEELVNYFSYHYEQPGAAHPFGVSAEISPCPWNAQHRLLRVGLQGRTISSKQMPPRNLVFLIDVSGSMYGANKLPLLKRSLALLVPQLRQEDRVAMVVYAGASGMVLPPTQGDRKNEILGALARLRAGGSTNGGAGIGLAYQVARRSFRKKGINRVILATDGDFNVGTTNRSELVRLIEKERESGVYLTVLGFGMGNYKDSTMESLANKGNGNYAYIDSLREANKVLVEQSGGTLMTIAKDVKLQLEFNPRLVQAYRLIGYENRLLKARDFNDDKKDAGELGAGHTVTALYEIVPPGVRLTQKQVDALKYQTSAKTTASAQSDELVTVKLRYKEPDGKRSTLMVRAVRDDRGQKLSTDQRFAAAVAAFGMLLRRSKHAGNADFGLVRKLAKAGRGQDERGYRAEFLQLVDRAAQLSGRQSQR